MTASPGFILTVWVSSLRQLMTQPRLEWLPIVQAATLRPACAWAAPAAPSGRAQLSD
jgi:hypothetical protein